MNKLNKLFAILFAVLGVNALSAQTDVTDQYLTNADFSSTDGWTAYASSQYRDYGQGNIGGKLANYTASTTDATHLSSECFFGFQCRWSGNFASYNQETSKELPAGVYTLSFDVENVNGSTTAAAYSNLFYVKVGGTTFTDPSTEWMKGKSDWTSHSITFVITEAAKAIVSLGYGTGTNNFVSGNTPVLYVSHLKLFYRDLDDISVENPADFTSYIVNNSFETGDLTGWTYTTSSDTGVKPNSNGTYTTSGVDGNYLFNTWWKGVPITQTVSNLPNGIYQLNVLVASGDGNGTTPDIYLLANGEHSNVYTISDGNNGVFHDISYEFKVLNGQATIGVVGGNDDGSYNVEGHWWYKADNFRLTYKGADLTILQEAFATNYSDLEKLSTDNIPVAFANKITNLLSTYGSMPANKKDLQTANTAISAVVNEHPSIVAAYGELDVLIDLCENYSTNSEPKGDAKTTFDAAITTAETAAANAVAVKSLTDAYAALETARQAYVLNAYPINGVTFDLTFKANTAWANGGNNYTAAGVVMKERYSKTPYTGTVMSTSYTEVPNGVYEVQVYCNANAAMHDGTWEFTDGAELTSVHANDVSVKIPVKITKGNDYANVITLTDVIVKDQTLTVEIVNDDLAANWVVVAHKSLTLKAALDVSEQQATVAELLTNADALKSKAMSSTVKTELTTAINNADATNDNPDELESMISVLNTAIANANASIEFYATVLPYITKAESIDASIAAEYRTQYDNGTIAETAETVFQKLEVATYEYVTENFTYAVALSDTWNSTGTNTSAATYDTEHWSGEKREYKNQFDSWGDPKQGFAANSWSIDFNQDVTLPAGEYVFKVAGRKSPDATLELVVTMGETILGTVNDFPSTNDALGINKAGETSFEANDPAGFAKDGKGWGWQWRYVKFELDEEAIVKVAIHAETNQASNWVSFSDYTLQMTEDTYLEANKGGLDAPTAAAEALVDTKPMGNAENEALEAALAMTYTTGAGLQEKINALNAAVANANAWLAAYNEAKAPLVAALERFEADYNNAENGALGYMNKSRWATAIEKAQAAAVAKDATDSYAGFADATAALVAALDAATVSVNEYASLKSAITEATVVRESEVNWGDAPFQRPESAQEGLNTAISAAESGYDAAEADGEEVTALIDAMAVTLNVPQDAYCITVATDGHAYAGCPVVASLGSITDNNPTGYGLAAKKENEDLLAQLYTFTQVEGNKYRISVTVEGKTVYLTYGVLNDSQAGHKNWQIQGNTDIAKAGEFEVVASTTTEGVFRLRNTVTGTFLDCQDGGAIYTDDNITKDEFALTSATGSAAINISADAKLGTCVLMFDAQLPDGLTAYVPESYDNETTVLTLKMVTGGVLPAYTPCLLYAEGGYEGTLTGTVTMNGYAGKVTGDDGLLYGAIESQTITEGYILQKHDGQEVAKFYSVDGLGEIPISAGKCWLTLANGVEEALETPAAVAFFFRGGGATKLNAVVMDKTSLDGAIYTLDGKRVNTMQRGEIYIINGQKVMVK